MSATGRPEREYRSAQRKGTPAGDAPGRPGRAPADRNVLGGPLAPCSTSPRTGFFRDGCCNTGPEDHGLHVICAEVTAAFLAHSRERGNDLSTPQPEIGFPGLKPGDRWCLCAGRWREAFDAGCAPPVILSATHEEALAVVPLATLRECALDAEP